MAKRLLIRAQPLFLAVAVVFIGLLLRSQWATLRNHSWRLHGGWFLLSGLFMLASWSLEVGIWQHLLRLMGGRLPYLAALRIWFLSAIIRYIPGNIWQPLSMTIYCQNYNIRPEASFTSVALYQAVNLLAVAPIAAFYFPVTGNWGLLTNLLSAFAPWLMALGLLPVILFLARPGWLMACLNWALHKAGRQPLTTRLSSRELLRLLFITAFNWVLWGASFAAITFALGDYTHSQMLMLTPHLIAVYAIAYAIGFISFITPSGLGVREGAFYLLLVPLMDGGGVTVAALAMRLWTMFGEGVMALLSLLVGRVWPLKAPEGTLRGEPT
ncbi:MAG: lysylphosphatidylglycerol synthase domain-containing protein [Chloroflexi bacterium]|nr:lysylphosphatidylglycerol synthase domain-containing protein [Chloroflexota bacterium]